MCDDWSFPKAKFLKKPSFLFVKTFVEENVDKLSIEDVPLSITIENCVFNFLCGSLWDSNHFTSIFRLNGANYLVDDMKKTVEKKIPEHSEIRTLFFYLA